MAGVGAGRYYNFPGRMFGGFGVDMLAFIARMLILPLAHFLWFGVDMLAFITCMLIQKTFIKKACFRRRGLPTTAGKGTWRTVVPGLTQPPPTSVFQSRDKIIVEA